LTGSRPHVLLVHAPADSPLDYGRRLGRLRWRRALGGVPERSARADAAASEVLAGSRVAVLLRDHLAIPEPVADALRLFTDRVVPARPLFPTDVPSFQTLRELEAAGLPLEGAADPERARIPAVGFDVSRLPPREGETLLAFTIRAFDQARDAQFDPEFRALVVSDPLDRDRLELSSYLPGPVRRLCDVGALGPDPAAELGRFARDGEKFDAFLFSGVLENLEDPIQALTVARQAASPDAALVASVPNVGHVSLVGDLLLGRMDPAPMGLGDARHIRWFDRRFLSEALEEADWSVERVEGLSGAPPEAESFFSRFADWPDLDRTSLTTLRWIAVARAADRSPIESKRSRVGRRT
jgi:hypothetical protein